MTDTRRGIGTILGIGLALCLGCGYSGGGDTGTTEPSDPPEETPVDPPVEPPPVEPPVEPPTEPPPEPPAADSLGFVFTSFGFDYPTHDVDPCPGGFNMSPREREVETGEDLPDDCNDPEANVDPYFTTLDADGEIAGFDLDDVVSSRNAPIAGECSHDDFAGPAGEQGFDYQLWRVIGCIRGMQDGEIVQNVQDNAIINGSMTILLEIRGVDDLMNDDEVQLQVFGATDAPPLGADGKVLPFGTLGVHEEARFHSEVATGQLIDGVITAGPIDMLLRLNIQIVDADLPLHDTWVRVELQPDGSALGQIFGYWPVDDAYEVFGRQAGAAGADALAYTCTGLYEALNNHADGGFDAETGACSSLSTTYQFTAQPAFVVK